MGIALREVVAAVKAKKELAALDEEFVLGKVKGVLKKEKRIGKKLSTSKSFREFSRSSEFKELKRLVREELRKVYGVFQEKGKGRNAGVGTPEELLLSHQSSAERYSHYGEIYRRIFSITGLPSSVLDLGCGANPYSYKKLGCRPFYVAVDLPSDDLSGIAAFFKEENIDGEVFGLDLVKDYGRVGELTKESHFDVAFLFKLLDSLETIKRHVSGNVLDAINAGWLVVSFPTVSIGGGKRIRKERRAWFEKLLARRGWVYEQFELGGEVFYIIRRGDA